MTKAMDDLDTGVRHKVRQQGLLSVGVGIVWGALVVALYFAGGLGSLWEGWRNWNGGLLKPLWFAVLGTFSIGWLFAVARGIRQLVTGRASPDEQEQIIQGIEREAELDARRTGSRALVGHTAPVAVCAYSGDGQLLVSGGRDAAVKVWDTATGALVATFPGATSPNPSAFAISGDGTLLADVRDDGSLRILDLASGEERMAATNSKRVLSCAFSPDDAVLAVGDSVGGIALWDVGGGMATPLGAHAKSVSACAFSPDGAFLATASADKTTKVWDVATGSEVRSLARHKHGVKWCAFSPDGSLLVTLGSDGFLVWAGDALLATMSLDEKAWIVSRFSFSVDGRELAYAAANEVILRDVGIAGLEPRTFLKVKKPILCCAVSPDGRHLATAGEDKKITIWEMAPAV